jgi:hypothetical protein
LFLSAEFLASKACLEEKEKALQLRLERNVIVIPIVLSECGWLDDNDLSSLLALPTDGKPISEYEDSARAWKIVYEGIKNVIDQVQYARELIISEKMVDFLNSADMLTSAHSRKEKVLLEDIFVFPDLVEYKDMAPEEKVGLETIIKNFGSHQKIVISGENLSGRTTICKKFFLELRSRDFIPIFISDSTNNLYGKIENRIDEALANQYMSIDLERLKHSRIVPIVDNFHLAKNKKKIVEDLMKYQYQIIIVDDIFSLNIVGEELLGSFHHYKIEEMNPLLRNRLIQKWIHLNNGGMSLPGNRFFQKVDEKVEIVESTLGKIFGRGVMPAYPFYILSIISAYEVFSKPLDQEITSQGYCYQALVILYLTKNGVEVKEMDTYINFLTEFSFYLYEKQKQEITRLEFKAFVDEYKRQYNLPVDVNVLETRLCSAGLILIDNFGNYSFKYPYIYFFFVAKYFAENIEDKGEMIDQVLDNLHIDENAYIAIFISHHSRSNYVLDRITLNALLLFDDYEPVTLRKDEVSFFDSKAEIISKAVLTSSNPNGERENRLLVRTRNEEVVERDGTKAAAAEEEGNDTSNDVRRAIKTVEVMGQIIKNRAGSLKLSRLEEIFLQAMNVNLRILGSFINFIENEDGQDVIVRLISERIEVVLEKDKEKREAEGRRIFKPTKGEITEIANSIFWNVNFFFVLAVINKTIKALGSDQLDRIVEQVCDEIKSPAAYLVKYGILMWYSKNLDTEGIIKKMNEEGFSEIAKEIMKYLIVDFCSMHKINFKELQRIEKEIGIPKKQLLIAQAKKK